jgi:hypothetical protein
MPNRDIGCNSCFKPIPDDSKYIVWCSEACRQKDVDRLINSVFYTLDKAIQFQQNSLTELDNWEYKIKRDRPRYMEISQALVEKGMKDPWICGYCGKEKPTETGICRECWRTPSSSNPSTKGVTA